MHTQAFGRVAGVVAIAGVVVVGCGRKEEKDAGSGGPISSRIAESIVEKAIAKQSGGEADVTLRDGKVSVKTDEGSFQVAAEGGLTIPDTFPKDIPVYDGANVIEIVESDNNFHLLLQSSDPAAAIAAFYKAKLEADGWATAANVQTPAGQMTSFTKGTRSLSAMFTIQEADTLISLTLATN